MNISIQSLNYESNKYPDIIEMLNMIKELGAQYLDMAAFENWQGIYPSKLMDSRVYDDLIEAFKSSGLKLDSINCGFMHQVTTKDEDEFAVITKHFTKVCEFANELNVRNITIGPGNITNREQVSKNLEMLLKRMPSWGNIASEKGLQLSLECHQGSTLEQINEMKIAMEELYPQVGLTFDPSHMEMQSISLDDAVPLMKYVYHSHIRCASPDNMQQTYDKNTLDIKKAVKMLKDVRYNGCVAVEYFEDFNDGKEMPIMIDILKEYGLNM